MMKNDLHHDLDRKNKNKPIHNPKFIEEQTESNTSKKTCFKSKFIQWLKELPLDQRYLAAKVYSPGLAKRIQEALIEFQNEPNENDKKEISINKKAMMRQAKVILLQMKQIIESIVLISDGEQFFDNIGFDFTYIEYPQKLYELLLNSLTPQQKYTYLTEKHYIKELNLQQTITIIEKSQTREEMTSILIQFLRRQIFSKYEQKVTLNLEEERNRKKQFSMFWRNCQDDYRRKILMLYKDDFLELSKYLAEKKIYLEPEDLQKEIKQLLSLEKNQFCNKIFKCKLKKSLTFYTNYHELIYRQWKSEINKKKKKQQRNQKNSFGEKDKPSASINRTSNMQPNQKLIRRTVHKNQKETEKIESATQTEKIKNSIHSEKNIKSLPSHHQTDKNPKILIQQVNLPSQKLAHKTFTQSNPQNQNVKRKRHRNKRKKSESAESRETNATNHKFQKEEKYQYESKLEKETSIASQDEIQIKNQFRLLTFHSLPCRSSEQLEKVQPQIFYPKIDYRQELGQKIRSDIQQYSDLINEEANEFCQRRLIAYQRIQFILGLWQIPIKLFGSCASGITIKNSDIDIAVDNSILSYFTHLPENVKLKAALEQLQQLLGHQQWVTWLKLIKTAAIPLIKLKVDTSIKILAQPGFQLYQQYIDALNRQHQSKGEIYIDLTIEILSKQLQTNHLGIISTDQINKWLGSIKSLHPIVIIVKNYLTKTSLNSTYQGGLNTYSMICMLVAFIKDRKLDDQSQVEKVFEKLLKFYSFQFDQKTTGIDLLSKEEIFYNKLKQSQTKLLTGSNEYTSVSKGTPVFSKADFEIKDPLNNGKIMTKNCYSFPKIRELFKFIYRVCFQQQTNKFELLFKDQFKKKNDFDLNGHPNLASQNQKSTLDHQELVKLLQDCKKKLNNPFFTLFE